MDLSNIDVSKLETFLDNYEENRKNEFPLYPVLSAEGHNEAQVLINNFKDRLIEIAKEAIGELYVDAADYIESDSWQNFRNTIMAGMRDYGNRHRQGEWDFKEIRKKIYEEYRDEIIADLNQDLVEENEKLKKDVKHWQGLYRDATNRSAYY